MSKKYDAIIGGTGQSGPALAGRLDQEGLKTAIYNSFARTHSDAAYSKTLLEYCRDMANYICGTPANS